MSKWIDRHFYKIMVLILFLFLLVSAWSVEQYSERKAAEKKFDRMQKIKIYRGNYGHTPMA